MLDRALAGSAQSAVDARSQLFPDYGLRAESERLSASFDPFNFAVHTERSHATDEEAELIRTGKFDQAKAFIESKLDSLPPEKRIGYALSVTSEAHELRHYHDHFATTFGFSRVMETIQDGQDFSSMWQSIRQSGQVKLPLLKWAQADDAPAALRDYATKRRSYVERFVLNDGAVKATVNILQQEPTRVPTDAISVIHVGGLQSTIPMADMNFKNPRTGQYTQKLFPLGGNILMEGNAFTTQRDLASRLFGGEYERELKKALSSGPVGDDYWMRYMAVDFYVSKRLRAHNVKFQLAFSDLAMMVPVEGQWELQDSHPGWRFFKAINAVDADKDRDLFDCPYPKLTEYTDGLARKFKWPTALEVTRQAIRKCETVLKEIENDPHRASFWTEILSAAVNLHLKWMRVREAFPEVLLEPELNSVMFGSSLAPPAHVDKNGIWFQGRKGTADAKAFRQWFLFEHFQRQLLFSRKLPCPTTVYAGHRCPGDPIDKEGWTPTDECLFSQLLEGLGIRDISFIGA